MVGLVDMVYHKDFEQLQPDNHKGEDVGIECCRR